MPIIHRGTRAPIAALALVAVSVAGCSANVGDGPQQAAPLPSYGCIDDSKQCIDQRQSQLRALQSDRTKTWVRQPASIGSYATGVRLFAFKTEKQKLSCDELAIGRREADQAPGTLRSPQAASIQPGIRNRSLMLADEVGKELSREAQRRCRA
jgi:hypothetical protein